MHSIREMLKNLFNKNKAYIDTWINTELDVFGGKSPAQMVAEGKKNDVMQVLIKGLPQGSPHAKVQEKIAESVIFPDLSQDCVRIYMPKPKDISIISNDNAGYAEASQEIAEGSLQDLDIEEPENSKEIIEKNSQSNRTDREVPLQEP